MFANQRALSVCKSKPQVLTDEFPAFPPFPSGINNRANATGPTLVLSSNSYSK